jgi:hypothetical protein
MVDQVGEKDFAHLPAETRELFSQLEMLNRHADIPARITLLKRLLQRVSRQDESLIWPELQVQLGGAYEENLEGKTDQRTRLRRAITCYDAALIGYTPETTPDDWAKTQLKKGNALRELAGLQGRARQAKTLRAAIACYDAELTVFTREVSPTDWAMVQNCKGVALCHLSELLGAVRRAKVLEEAILCYDAALLGYRRDVAPADWAVVQNNKGNALNDLVGLLMGIERAKVLREALSATIMRYESANVRRCPENGPWYITTKAMR